MIERRRHFDPTPRATYAASNIIGNTKLVMKNGYAHAALLALGFEPIDESEPDAVLLKAPVGARLAQERDGDLPL